MPPRKRRGNVKPAGQIRQSQIVTTFGPGAMVDLPDHAVIIGGLDHWNGYKQRAVEEDRLAAKVKTLLGWPSVEFFAPPADVDDPNAEITGITAWLFPEWFIAHYEVKDEATGIRSRPLVHRNALQKGMWQDPDRKSRKVVPVRFVQACVRGHVSDINWRVFVHGTGDQCSRNLWMDERGTSGDLTDITIRCECQKSAALSKATKRQDQPLGFCEGLRPWLGQYSREKCGGAGGTRSDNRLLVRSASNAYFAQTLSVISIPEREGPVREAVDRVWVKYLQAVESADQLKFLRLLPEAAAALEGLADGDIMAEVKRRRDGGVALTKGIREAELETLLSSPDTMGDDRPGGDFFARTMPVPPREAELTGKISRIVKVYRLREVIAQVGFTRFEAAVSDVNGELDVNVERASLSIDQQWLPAVENRGEGVFLGFTQDAMQAWLERPSVRAREQQLRNGFDAWAKAHPGSKALFPGAAYVMLHSLSHLLITSVALECGYAASSIRERIYALSSGYGILLYTASPDAEGTLGGLVETADRMDRYLRTAMELGQLCSNDPVCAQHQPDALQEERYLHGAACHGCLLLAESSCERRNDFLDRALVVPTVDSDGAAFFEDA
jgi:hypothetical protein